jgi:RimJ/RimL family protein N-acetyltransferase
MLFFETERLHIRTYEERDCKEVTEYLSTWAVTGPLGTPPWPFYEKDARNFLARMQKTYEANTPEFFVIADKQTDKLLGGIGVHDEHTFAIRKNVAEVGYWLGVPHWHKGYLAEAMPPLLRYVFYTRPFRLLVATTDTDNYASQRVLARCGFTCYGQKKPLEPPQRGSREPTYWEMEKQAFLAREGVA